MMILAFAMPAVAQHNIILRDLTLIENASVESLDTNGIKLKSGLRYSWADILQGSVGEFQTEFDERLKTIGEPLFRIRYRLALGNYAELQPMTDALLENLEGRAGSAMYIASAAKFQDHLFRSERELAVVPLLRLLELRSRDSALAELDSRLGLRFLESGICAGLLPVWFDPEAARKSFSVLKHQLPDNPQGARNEVRKIYIESLLACFETDQESSRKELPGHLRGYQGEWSPILSAQSALLNKNHTLVIESLGGETIKRSAEQHAIALYYRGLANREIIQSPMEKPGNDYGESSWVLQLLRIPAIYGDQFPELSAAAIYEVITDPEQNQATIESLSLDLTGRFSSTWHGRRYHQEKN